MRGGDNGGTRIAVVSGGQSKEGICFDAMIKLIRRLAAPWLILASVPIALAQPSDALPGVRAHLRMESRYIVLGSPIWAFFSIENASDESITLTVPRTELDLPDAEIGLPKCHVFSGTAGTGVVVVKENGRKWESPVGYRPPKEAPPLLIAPRSTVGTRLDLRALFPALKSSGKYTVTWRPYGGEVTSETVSFNVAPLKQAEILTDFGRMTVRFFHQDAPEHVANFIELAEDGFYDNLTLHNVSVGFFIIGGCPRGDGTGIRPDGKLIPAEPNQHEHKKGSVSMALLNDDPDSGSCQFFISNTRKKDWDGRYTVFGELADDESLATLDALMRQPVDADGRPNQTIYLRSVRIVNAPVG